MCLRTVCAGDETGFLRQAVKRRSSVDGLVLSPCSKEYKEDKGGGLKGGCFEVDCGN